ncbi:MAG TPA: GNAT family N-acetyltransferase [Mycobacteriales bacterium]|nr:GNAT family N-acetyltransferase [Mycobacteriales bacterium]
MVTVRQVAAADTTDLRRRVLRGGRPVALPGDDDPTAFHVGAFDDDRLVGTGNVRREPAPWAPDEPAWRLRGMATEEDRRGTGVGERVLAALVAHCRERGGGELWCNARTPARSFYRRAGFTEVGEEWVDPEIGPHVRMRLDLGS